MHPPSLTNPSHNSMEEKELSRSLPPQLVDAPRFPIAMTEATSERDVIPAPKGIKPQRSERGLAMRNRKISTSKPRILVQVVSPSSKTPEQDAVVLATPPAPAVSFRLVSLCIIVACVALGIPLLVHRDRCQSKTTTKCLDVQEGFLEGVAIRL